ncbi:hypothetical protein GCM10023264_27770 [Sphingomonas daechungensis]|uniref:Uncharacterized protein n=1 Tax=Sphingomonas daechungensis TaxID=1176646 RepID=A0ABX6T0K6_9SPHN|nr:hypothetical protein [Sphingomonas daechungensis]QNP43346.1 hypothetical protein H9L15_00210 [Sphingomonas daechungensis]
MKHEVIERADRSLFQRIALRPRRRRQLRAERIRPSLPHSRAANRFAETCAGIGGTTMLHDLMPDIVTVSFGERTKAIHARLHSQGWKSVGLGDWQGERVLGVSFGGDRRATRTADDLLDALIAIVGEMEIAETRAW